MTEHFREVSDSSVHLRTEPSTGLVLLQPVEPIQRILAVQLVHSDQPLRLQAELLLHLLGDLHGRLAVQLPRLPGVKLRQRLAVQPARADQPLRLLGVPLQRRLVDQLVHLRLLHGVQRAHVDSLQRLLAVQLVRGVHQRPADQLLRENPSHSRSV